MMNGLRLNQWIKSKILSFLGLDSELRYIHNKLDYNASRIRLVKKEVLELNAQGLSQIALDEVVNMVQQAVKDERKNTLWFNNQQRDFFMSKVEEYITKHHHDSLYARNKV